MRRQPIENHKMKARCFDHIDLREKDMEVAKKSYGKFLPQLGFVRERHEPPPPEKGMGGAFHTFYSAGGDKPSEFFGFIEDKNHQPNGTRIAFWADTREQVDQVAKLVRDAGGRALEGRKSASTTVPGITRSSSRIRIATSSRFAAAKVRSLLIKF